LVNEKELNRTGEAPAKSTSMIVRELWLIKSGCGDRRGKKAMSPN
jgi:hypothetical protein